MRHLIREYKAPAGNATKNTALRLIIHLASLTTPAFVRSKVILNVALYYLSLCCKVPAFVPVTIL